MATSATCGVGPGSTLVSNLPLPILIFLVRRFMHLLVDQLHSHIHRFGRGLLQVGIDRRVDAVGLLVDFALIELADQRVADQIDEIRSIAGFDIRRRKF